MASMLQCIMTLQIIIIIIIRYIGTLSNASQYCDFDLNLGALALSLAVVTFQFARIPSGQRKRERERYSQMGHEEQRKKRKRLQGQTSAGEATQFAENAPDTRYTYGIRHIRGLL